MNWQQLRKNAKLTQLDVVKQMNELGFSFHQSTIHNIEKGTRDVSFREGLFLIRIFDVKIQDIEVAYPDSYICI